ncbi:hypothetical protein CB452P1_000019 [Clostridium phage CB452P1]|nr:hypothetical protein CB452P1_000019 [Clostridium phage CB452P1]
MYKINIGDKFNEWTVLSEDERKNGKRRLICKCSCGKISTVDGYKLRNGKSKSCGCKKSEYSKISSTKHGGKGTILYSKWCGIKRRCNNKNDKHYKNYGGRGIKICNSWNESFEEFREWSFKNGYKENLTIERIDVNKGYEPLNCKWITLKEQASNKNNTVRVIYNGEIRALVNIAEELNINKKTLSSRYNRFIKRNPNIDKNTIEYNMLIPR